MSVYSLCLANYCDNEHLILGGNSITKRNDQRTSFEHQLGGGGEGAGERGKETEVLPDQLPP